MDKRQRSLSFVKGWTKIICRNCKKTFYVVPCIAHYVVACSLTCRAVSQKNRYSYPKWHPDGYKPLYYKIKKIKGKKIRLHRYVMEQFLGRKLKRSEHVHHIDGNRHNNDIANLQIMSCSEHHRLETLSVTRKK